MSKYMYVFILLTVLSLTIRNVEPCTCEPLHPQEIVCSSDFAIKVKVLSVTALPNIQMRVYSVYVKEVFKTNQPTLYQGCTAEIYTPLSSATCGVILEIGKSHVLTGVFHNGNFITYSCGFNRLWWDLSSHQRNSLRNRYTKCCQCKVGEGDCRLPGTDDEERDCYNRYATCIERKNKCTWKKGIGMEECLEQLQCDE